MIFCWLKKVVLLPNLSAEVKLKGLVKVPLFSINQRLCKHCSKTEWTLVHIYTSEIKWIYVLIVEFGILGWNQLVKSREKTKFKIFRGILISFWMSCMSGSVIDVLWCQPIKLIHVVSTSEFHEYWRNDVDFIFFVPSI